MSHLEGGIICDSMSDNIHHKVLLEGDYRLSPTTLLTHTFFAGEYKHLKKWFSYYYQRGFFRLVVLSGPLLPISCVGKWGRVGPQKGGM